MRVAAFLIGVLLAASLAHAAEWDTIRPGETTQAAVRAHLGEPTSFASQKVEGYDTTQWIYESAQAPRGVVKLTIEFGLLTPQGYKADIVRVVTLRPRPGVFTRQTVVDGWGEPQAAKTENEVPLLLYESGLIASFDKEGWLVTLLVFTPPQKLPPAPAPR
jgi:hypothetical protein